MGGEPRRNACAWTASSPSSPRVTLRTPRRRRRIVSPQSAQPWLPGSRAGTCRCLASKWEAAEVRIVGDEQAQRALRFATYHLIAAANPDDERVSIGARGLTGEAYKGHVFWDTEIYMLPFYVFTDPPAARALLMYRYHTLRCGAAQGQGATAIAAPSTRGNRPTPVTRPRRALVVAPDGGW